MYTLYLDTITQEMKLALRWHGYDFGYTAQGYGYIKAKNAQDLSKLAVLLEEFE
jgi:hypothetical protein